MKSEVVILCWILCCSAAVSTAQYSFAIAIQLKES